MVALRLVGGVLALALLVQQMRRYSRRNASRLNLIITFAVPVVVDDGSEDATRDVARAAGALVARHPIRRGGGLAMRVGYEIGKLLAAEVVVTMDADGQHVPDEMPLLVKPIVEGQADLVNGSRVLGEFERESMIRHVGVHFFSRIVTIMIGTRITDVSNGYRAVRTDVLQRRHLDQAQFWDSGLMVRWV